MSETKSNSDQVNNYFNQFLQKFILQGLPLLKATPTDFNLNQDYKLEKITIDDIHNCQQFIANNDIKTLLPPSKKGKTDVSLKSALDNLTKNEDKYKFHTILWHCYWIMYLMNNTSSTFLGKSSIEEHFLRNGEEIASTKLAYTGNPIQPFIFLLQLFKQLFEKNNTDSTRDENTIKNKIIEILKQEYNNKTNWDNRIKNILLYLCNPQIYPCIISQTHQDNIYKNLKFLLSNKDNEIFGQERDIVKIEGVLGNKKLYSKDIKALWNFSQIKVGNDDSPILALLKYKKSMVLYGPPGTSKSYQARAMAKSLILNEFVGKKKKNIAEFIQNQDYIYNTHIHTLQMHPNYTYDDFIVGKTIISDSVVAQKGYLMKLIDKIEEENNQPNNNNKLPHILILDEINRVDISRVFGELFTAMERSYRKDGIDLPIKGWKLKVPENLYIIGTMNMIDFSLEQVDFALRRRFLWVLSTYEEKRLKEIVEEKLSEPEFTMEVQSDELNDFYESCTKLNNIIKEEPSLGETYWIGHAFFAEIVNLFEEIKSWEKAWNMLWQISIKPTLEAYCGTMNTKAVEAFISKCKNAFKP